MRPHISLLALLCLSLPAAAEIPSLRDILIEGWQDKLEKIEPIDPDRYLPGATRQGFHYGRALQQTLEVYAPPDAHAAPIVVMVHGGGWILGDKNVDRVVVNKVKHWLPLGFIFVSVDYRLAPEAPPDVEARDVAAALAYVQANAPAWGGDPARLILMGHSAGAHLVALISADPRYVTDAGGSRWSGTVVLDSAALDVPSLMRAPHIRLYDDAFGTDPAYWTSVSPADQIRPDAVPMLLVCSELRPDLPCKQARAFAERLEAVTGTAPPLSERAMTHNQINADLGEAGDYTTVVDAFIAGRLGGP